MDKSSEVEMVSRVAAADINAVREVLWHLGDQVLGQQPGSFFTALLVAMDRADRGNYLKLSLVFPTHAEVLHAARHSEPGIELLRDRAKAVAA